MLGQIEEWFYHDLAGIQGAPGSPGFKAIVISPQPVGDVTWARASYESIRGKIVSDWKRTEKEFTLKTVIPPNTTATVFVPAISTDKVTEHGKPVELSDGVKSLGIENGRAVFSVESGSYEFKSQL